MRQKIEEEKIVEQYLFVSFVQEKKFTYTKRNKERFEAVNVKTLQSNTTLLIEATPSHLGGSLNQNTALII